MARLFKKTYPQTRVLKDPGGKLVMVRNGRGRLVPKRQPVLDVDGKPVMVTARRWTIEYTRADGRPKRQVAYTDRRASEKLMADLGVKAERVEAGVRDQTTEHLVGPIGEHLEAYERRPGQPVTAA